MYNRKQNTGSWVRGSSSHNRYNSNDDYGMDFEEGSYSRFRGGQNQQSVGGPGTSFSRGRYTGLSNERGGSYRGTNMYSKQRSYDTHSHKSSFNQESEFYSMDYQRETGNFYNTSQTWKGGMEEQESFNQYDDERNNDSIFQKRRGFYGQGGGEGVGTSMYSQRKDRAVHQGGRSVFDPERLGEAPYEGQDRRSAFDSQRLSEASFRGQQKIGNQSLLGEPLARNQSLHSESLGGSQSLLGEPIGGNRSLLGKPFSGNHSVVGPQRGGSISLMGAPPECTSLLGEPPAWPIQSQSRPGMEAVVGDIVNQVLDLQGGRSGLNTRGHRSRFGEHRGSFSKWKGSSSHQQQQQHNWNDPSRYSLVHNTPQIQQQVSGLGNLHQSFSPYPTERFQQHQKRGKNNKFGKMKGPKNKINPVGGVQPTKLKGYSARALRQMEMITKKALHCNICKPFKFGCGQNNVHEYLAHQDKPKHRRYRVSYNVKVVMLVEYLMAEAQLSFARKFVQWNQDAGGDLCKLCKVPKLHEGEDHLDVYECWVNHEYNQPTCVCKTGKFKNRILFEDHCLCPLHLKGEYDYRTNKGVEYRVGKEEVKLMSRHFRSGVGLAYESFNNTLLDKRVIINEAFGANPVPTQISWLLDALKRMMSKAVQRQKISHPKFTLQYYNPTYPKGPEPVIFESEFECSLCNVTLGTAKQSVLDHCATKEHYDNIKDEEKLQGWLSDRADEAAGKKKRYIYKGIPDNFKTGIPTKGNDGGGGDDYEDDDEVEDEDYEMDDD